MFIFRFETCGNIKPYFLSFSSLGFIDFIVEPTFSLLTDSMEKIVMPLIEEATKSESPAFGTPRYEYTALLLN